MFFKKYRDQNSDFAKEQNRIAESTTIIGDIEAEGFFRIEGILKGGLKTPKKIVVSPTGVIEGDVECGEADFQGKFTGNIMTVKNRLSLRSTAEINGDITMGELIVEEGANLNGNCTMKSTVKKLDNEQQERSA